MDYYYNINVRLVDINDIELSTEVPGSKVQYVDKFGEKLGYESAENIALNSASGGIDGFEAKYNGNITWSVYNIAGFSQRGFVYNYDDAGRLIKSRYAKNSGIWHTQTPESNLDISSRLTYYPDGRIKFHRINAGANAEPPNSDFANYVYKTNTHQLDHISNLPVNYHNTTQQSAGNYIYDRNGNMIADISKNMLVFYDWRDLPVRYEFYNPGSINSQGVATGSPKKTVKMVYDADGVRVSKTETVAGGQ